MRELAVRETDDEYARLWQTDENDRTLFVTHLTPDSATRYQFDVQDAETGACVYSKGDGITPPRVVVELLNETGYTATNLPNIDDADPDIRANHLIDAIQWLAKHGGFEPGDLRVFAYQRAQNVLTVVWGSHILLEVIGPDRYEAAFEDALDNANRHGRRITRDELLEPRTHDIELLQTLLIEMRRSLPTSDQERVVELVEERLGISASKDADPSEYSQTWESSTSSESKMTLDSEATATLIEEGWLDPSYAE